VRQRSYTEIERHLLKACAPLHGLQLASITRRDVASVLSTVETASGPTQCNRTRASLSAFFTWASRQGVVEHNPVTATERRTERSRERTLSDSELREIWLSTERGGAFASIVRLLMLGGMRREEAGGLRWSEVEDDRLIIPSARTKNGRVNVVPLSEPMRAILAAQPKHGAFVFGRKPFSSWSASKRLLDERMAASGIAGWRLHDLRRTCPTGMIDIGVQPHVVEAVLNHVSGHKAGVAGIYNRALYEAEKRQALDRWGEHVMALVEERRPTVVALRG